MATKKKELLEQENPVPETAVLGTTAEDMAVPDAETAAGEDLNTLLAAMDQPDGNTAADGDGDSDALPELTEEEVFGDGPADEGVESAEIPAAEDADTPRDGEAASGITGEESDTPPEDEPAETPPVAKPQRTSRRKKAADAPADAPAPQDNAEAPLMDDLPTEDAAAAVDTPALEENAADDSDAGEESPPEDAPQAPARRRNAQPHRDASILTIRSREEVETQEDREDIIWHEIHNAYRTRRILTGQLGGMEQLDNRKTVAVVDYKGFRIIIPLKEMMINLGRSPSGQEYTELMLRQNKILGNMLGADIDFVVRGIDSKTRSVVASRREAMMRKRQIFYFDLDADGMYRVYEGRIVQARVIAVAEKVIRVEVFGVECSILARDLAWDWIGDAHERFAVGDEVLVRILSVRRESLEDLSIKADIKSTTENTDRDNLQKCRIQGKYAGKVTDVHKGVVYVRLSNGVNAVAHSCYDYRMPGKKDDVSFAVTRLDTERGVAVGIITRIIRQNL